MPFILFVFLFGLVFGCAEEGETSSTPTEIDAMLADAQIVGDMSIEPMLPGPEANFDYRIGVESVTIFNATPGAQHLLSPNIPLLSDRRSIRQAHTPGHAVTDSREWTMMCRL